MMATNGNKCVQAEGIGEVYIARNKSVNKNIYIIRRTTATTAGSRAVDRH